MKVIDVSQAKAQYSRLEMHELRVMMLEDAFALGHTMAKTRGGVFDACRFKCETCDGLATLAFDGNVNGRALILKCWYPKGGDRGSA